MVARKMHIDEVDIDGSLVTRLVTDQFPHWRDLPIEPVPFRGTDNALYRLGDDLVVRLPRIPRASLTLRKELEWLPLLAPLLPLPIPAPRGAGEPAEGYPFTWSVCTWLEGQTATADRLVDHGQAAVDLAGFVAAMQQIDPTGGPPPGEHNAFRGVLLTQRDEATRAAIAALLGRIETRAATAVWEAALRAEEWAAAPVWIHGDLDARNMLVRAGRLSAVVDFGCLGVGDPACDVMVAWKVLSPDARRIFRSELSIDDATWDRGRGWALSQAVVALSYYTLETNPALVREAERWLEAVLGEQA